MSTTQESPLYVEAPVLGGDTLVEARVIGTTVDADIATGPRTILRLDVDGNHYRVPESDCTPL